tara:strand:- start:526 stop:1122 length:597 start_codon:yes stop_codon:yes gene_type:complete
MTIYTDDIPNSGESLGSTRVRIHDNFAQIFAVFNQNHVNFNETGEGKHKYLEMPELGTLIPPLTPPVNPTNECVVYAEAGTDPVETNLFLKGENNGFVYVLTAVDQARSARFGTNLSIGGGSTTTNGWIFLSGNIVLNYGYTGNAFSNNTNPKLFAKPYKAGTVPYYLSINGTSIDENGFNSSGGQAQTNWFAIGTIA